jgi:homotetrameric cytidine deaminase
MASPFQPASDESTRLREQARGASQRAYVPYSGFRVGAALEFEDGSVVTGCNVENASYGLTVRAERTAIVRAIAEGRDTSGVQRVAIHVDGPEGQPCGMCRLFMSELVRNATIAVESHGSYVECSADDLLPAAFVPGALEG